MSAKGPDIMLPLSELLVSRGFGEGPSEGG